MYRRIREQLSYLTWALMLAALPAAADIAVTQVGTPSGDDWEPSIAADGQYVYVMWAHFGAPGMTDSSGATCQTSQTSSYIYFQRSTNGGASWDPIIIPRCPVSGTQIDTQLVIGPNHRLYASYMDGPQANSNIEVIYSDDQGAHWSTPVNAAGSGGGDKDILLVDSSGDVMMTYEHLSSNYVSYSPNVATTPFSVAKIAPPADAKSGTSLAYSGVIDTHGNAYFFYSDATSNGSGDTYLWISSSSDHFQHFNSYMVDRSYAQPAKTGAGWNYWGAAGQLGLIPRAGQPTDRLVAVYSAGTTAGGAQRIYTKYSDTNGQTWSIPYNANTYPNGTELSSAPVGAWHGFPSIAGTSTGVKVIWQDNRVQFPCTSSSTPGQCGLWNVYTRSSADGATSWSAEAKMALPLVQSYQVATPAPGGFYHPYGDYTWMATDGLGNTYATWGEGTSYIGPGTVYVSKF